VLTVCEFLQQNSKTLQEVSGMIITHSCCGGLVPIHTEFHRLHSALCSDSSSSCVMAQNVCHLEEKIHICKH